MKKILISLFLGAFLSGPVLVSAQADTVQQETTYQLIRAITELISQLQLQLQQILAQEQFQGTSGQIAQTSIPTSVSVSVPIPAPVTVCTPDWQCGNWSACFNSLQTRTCTDVNNCNSASGEPNLSQSCAAAIPAANSTNRINTSSNWCGYAATGTDLTGVSGSWVLSPQIASVNGLTGDATWIGIGGIANPDLFQIGTQTFSNNGQIDHEPFYETLPQTAQNIPMTINTGDSISASIDEQSAGQWLLSIKDNTNGQHFEIIVPYISSKSSAEWIEEMPSNSDSTFIPLSNFGTVQFSGGLAKKNGGSLTIAQSQARSIIMTNGNNMALAVPSNLSGDGASFTVTRTSADPTSFTNWQKSTSVVHYRRGFDIHGYSNGGSPMP